MLKLLFLYKSNIPNTPMDDTNDYQSSLVNEIGRLCNLKKWGPGFDLYDDNIYDIRDIIKILYDNDKPDVIFYYFLNGHIVKYINFDKLQNIYKILLRIDPRYTHCAVFNPKDVNNPDIIYVNQYIEINKFNLVLSDMDTKYTSYPVPKHIPFQLFPRCADSNIFYPSNNIEKDIDITLCGAMADYYPLRKKILEELIDPKYEHLKIFIAPGRKSGDKNYPDPRIIYKDRIKQINDKIDISYSTNKIIKNINYSNLIRRSKIIMFCSSIYKYPLFKSVETMLCKSCAAFDQHHNLSDYGFYSTKTYINLSKLHLVNVVCQLLNTPDKLQDITNNGYNLAVKNHTYKVRAKQLIDFLTGKTKKIYSLKKD